MMSLSSSGPMIRMGVDVGGTKVAVLVAREGQEIARTIRPTRLESPEQTLNGIVDTMREAVAQSGVEMREVAAIGIGIPGRVSPADGSVQLAVNLNWKNMPVGSAITQRLGVPCFLENDVRTAALGVKYHPKFAQFNDLAFLSIGTGIAAGIILGGALHRGQSGMAGEIGHIPVDTEGERCPCGGVGCLETVAAGPALERLMRSALVKQNGKDAPRPLSAGQIFQMAASGETTAQAVIRQVSQYWGWTIRLLVFSYDVQAVVLGGGVARGTGFLSTLLQEIDRQRQESDLAWTMLRPEMLHLVPAEYEAPLWGAIALADAGLQHHSQGIRRSPAI
ncbi:MAG: ROK family protein [Anaerolineales bacterium]